MAVSGGPSRGTKRHHAWPLVKLTVDSEVRLRQHALIWTALTTEWAVYVDLDFGAAQVRRSDSATVVVTGPALISMAIVIRAGWWRAAHRSLPELSFCAPISSRQVTRLAAVASGIAELLSFDDHLAPIRIFLSDRTDVVSQSPFHPERLAFQTLSLNKSRHPLTVPTDLGSRPVQPHWTLKLTPTVRKSCKPQTAGPSTGNGLGSPAQAARQGRLCAIRRVSLVLPCRPDRGRNPVH